MTKRDDAATIIGDDLADDLAKAYNERRVKSDAEDTVVEKADDETTEKVEPEITEIVGDTTPADETEEKAEVESVEKAMRTPTKMSACIEKHVTAGKTREESISLCLQDAKKNGVQIELPLKSDADGETVEKQIFSTHGRERTFARGGGGGGFGPFPKGEKIGDCINRLMLENGMPYNAAKQTCESRHTKRLGLLSRADLEPIVSKPDMDYGTLDECVQSYIDEGMSEEAAMDHCQDEQAMKADLVQKPKLGAPMGECIQSYMAEGMKKDQAIAICLSDERKGARNKAGTEEGEIDAVLRALLTDDDIAYMSPQEFLKSEQDGDHPVEHYLVTVDPKKPTTWHLPVRKMDGSADEVLMAEALNSLDSGSYKGPMKEEAFSRLMDLYKAEQFPAPTSKELIEHADLEDILLVELLKADAAIDSLTEEILEMTDKAHGDDGLPTNEAADAENVEQVGETAKSETEEVVKTEDVETPEVKETPEKAETDSEIEETDPDVEKAEAGESDGSEEDAEVAPNVDVNESDVAPKAVKSETVSKDGKFESMDKIVTEIKAALADPSLDRSGQVLIANTLLTQLGNEVDVAIKQTPPSADDAVEAFKAGVVEVVNPLVAKIAQLEAENAALEQALDKSDWGGVIKPRATQLKYQGVEKSDADESGAMTSDQVAEQSVGYNRPVY